MCTFILSSKRDIAILSERSQRNSKQEETLSWSEVCGFILLYNFLMLKCSKLILCSSVEFIHSAIWLYFFHNAILFLCLFSVYNYIYSYNMYIKLYNYYNIIIFIIY